MTMPPLTHHAAQPAARPRTPLPEGACDCHTHVFGPYDWFPMAPERGYSPVEAPLAELQAVQAALGLRRVVIVQPSIYGTDNRCTLHALAALGPRGRGVAVVDPAIDAAALRALHQGGMRGVRLNLVSGGTPPVDQAAALLRHMADKVGPLGWHLQLFCPLPTIAALADTIRTLGLPVVLDHFAWPGGSRPPAGQGWDTLLGLVRQGAAFVKLSGQHRLLEQGMPLATLEALARSLVAANPGQLVWGTDWPHPAAFVPGLPTGALSPVHDIDDAGDLDRLAGWIGDPALLRRILAETPAHLYRFPAHEG